MPLDITWEGGSEGPVEARPSRCDVCRWPLVSAVHHTTCPRLDELTPPFVALETVAQARTWLSHPGNLLDTQLFVVKWEGAVPRLSAWKLDELFADPALAEVILLEHIRLRLHLSDEPSDIEPAEMG